MREKKSGALSKVQKIKKRLSHSFGRLCKYKLLFIIVLTYSKPRSKIQIFVFKMKLYFVN